jgi:light-harvesting complex I chlorophyll a/b binding protein 5
MCVIACHVCLPQGLGKDPEALRWYVQAELVHCRTAMAGVAGILIPAVSSSSSSLQEM